MPELFSPVDYAIPAFVILVILEMIWARRKAPEKYEPRDTLTSLALGTGSTVAGALTGALVFSLAMWLYQYRLFDIGWAWWAFILCFIADDFAYYWAHRAGHRVRWFWASHVNHHSSQHYNLSTALRQSWTGFFALGFIFRIPLALIGFHPGMLLFVGAINLVYQFWIHTEAIGKLPRWFEYVMNTPSHHRVHHGSNRRYLDRNHGGILIVWDRLFGSFQRELPDDDPVVYGLTRNVHSYNLWTVSTHEYGEMFGDVARSTNWRDRLGFVLRGPGWAYARRAELDGGVVVGEGVLTVSSLPPQ